VREESALFSRQLSSALRLFYVIASVFVCAYLRVQRKEIRQKSLFSVSEIAMFWHPDGTYLAVKVGLPRAIVQSVIAHALGGATASSVSPAVTPALGRVHRLAPGTCCNLSRHRSRRQVDRQKSKNTKSYSFELFRLRERDVPIEVLEIPSPVLTFAWEPKGHR